MSEQALVNACLVFLRTRGVFCWRANTGAAVYRQEGKRTRFVRFGMPGLSDICGVMRDGRALFVECKRPGNSLTQLQEYFLRQAKANGALAMCVYSVDDLEKALKS